jgi:hypothetical protein
MILYGFTMNMINTTCDATHYPDEKIRFKMRWLGFHAPKKKSDRYAKHTHTKHDSRRYTIRQCWAPHTQTQMHGVWYGDDLLSIYLIYPVLIYLTPFLSIAFVRFLSPHLPTH